ncbi:hypothetical protein MLD38_035189 [Melastoma candidum]|uniref:Uncharacterized protein n=1 Tax=Melastoma candidum TaxID=119954 RepID=A0ACB9ME36_9MYRT|nr:hypothetical protein MLD38_035189 [Melastoma candidum]
MPSWTDSFFGSLESYSSPPLLLRLGLWFKRMPSSSLAIILGTAVLLIWCNVPMALFCALGVSYLVLLLHAALRKLTPSKQPQRRRK